EAVRDLNKEKGTKSCHRRADETHRDQPGLERPPAVGGTSGYLAIPLEPQAHHSHLPRAGIGCPAMRARNPLATVRTWDGCLGRDSVAHGIGQSIGGCVDN